MFACPVYGNDLYCIGVAAQEGTGKNGGQVFAASKTGKCKAVWMKKLFQPIVEAEEKTRKEKEAAEAAAKEKEAAEVADKEKAAAEVAAKEKAAAEAAAKEKEAKEKAAAQVAVAAAAKAAAEAN